MAPETADEYTTKERKTNRILGYPKSALNRVIVDEDEDVETTGALTSVTGATDHLGENFRDDMQRVFVDAVNQTMVTSTFMNDTDGNVYSVRVTYEPKDQVVGNMFEADLGDAIESILDLHPDAQKVAAEFGDTLIPEGGA